MSDSGNRRDIELRIRVTDPNSTASFQQLSTSIAGLSAELNKLIAVSATAQGADKELAASLKQLESAGNAVATIHGLLFQFENFPKVLGLAEQSVTRAATALSTYQASGRTTETQLAKLAADVERQTATLATQRAAYDALGASLQKHGADLGNLTAFEQQLIQTENLVGASRTSGSIALRDYAKNIRLAKEAAVELAAAEKATAAAELAAAEKAARTAAERERRVAQVTGFNEEGKQRTAERLAAEKAVLADRLQAQQDYARKAIAAAQYEIREKTAIGREQNRIAQAALAQEMTTNKARIASAQTTAAALTGGIPGAKGAAAPILAFGLKPYELVNLSYQLNDVMSGIAMGQNAMQIFAQQAGQFFQIFGTKYITQITGFIKAFWLEMLIGAAAATVAVNVLLQAFRNIDSVREFNVLLKLTGDGTQYTQTAMVKLGQEIRRLGISYSDTDKILRQAISTGLNQNRIKEFAEAAQKLADIKEIPVVDAFKALTEAAQGGYDGIIKFESAYRILDAAQLANLHTQKDVPGILNTIITKLKEQKDTLSPFNTAVRDLTKSWGELIDAFNATPVASGINQWLINLKDFIDTIAAGTRLVVALKKAEQDVIKNETAKALEEAGPPPVPALERWRGLRSEQGVGSATGVLSGLSPEFSSSLKQLIADAAVQGITIGVTSGLRSTERQTQLYAADVAAHGGTPSGMVAQPRGSLHEYGVAADLARDPAALAFAHANAAQYGLNFPMAKEPWHIEQSGIRNTGVTPTPPPSQPDVRTLTPAEAKLSKERVADAERLLQIQYDLDRGAAKAAAVAEAEAKLRGTIASDDEIAFAKTQAADAFDREHQKTALGFEHQINDLRINNQRNWDTISAAGNAARDKAIKTAVSGRISEAEANTAQLQGMQEKIAELAKQEQSDEAVKQANAIAAQSRRDVALKSTTELAKAEQGVNEQYDTRIAQLNQILKLHPERATAIAADITSVEESRTARLGQVRIGAAEAQGNEALKTRNELITSYNLLADAGEISHEELIQKTKAAYDLLRGEILGAADALEKLAREAKNLTPLEVEKLTASVAKLKAEAKYVDADWKALKHTIEDSFVTNLGNAFNTVAEAIGGVIAKTKSWKDVISSLKTAFGEFFAGLLKDIAGAIIKLEAMKLLGLDSGGSGGGGIAGGLASLLLGKGSGGSAMPTAWSTINPFGDGWSMASLAMLHDGGVVGVAGAPRAVQASWFANAPRYHSGNPVVGLAPDEQAAILQRGEEVLSRSSPRNIMNGGGASSRGDLSIRNVLVFDESQIPAAMAGAHGERTIMAHVVKNAATIRQLVR